MIRITSSPSSNTAVTSPSSRSSAASAALSRRIPAARHSSRSGIPGCSNGNGTSRPKRNLFLLKLCHFQDQKPFKFCEPYIPNLGNLKICRPTCCSKSPVTSEINSCTAVRLPSLACRLAPAIIFLKSCRNRRTPFAQTPDSGYKAFAGLSLISAPPAFDPAFYIGTYS